MNILLLSESNIKYDGRLIELYKVSKMLGNAYLITVGNNDTETVDKNHIIIKERKNFFKKIIYFYHFFKATKRVNYDVLFLDNTSICIVGYFLLKLKKPLFSIIDSRELYLQKEIAGLKGKVLLFFEQKVIKKANVQICANIYRAKIMKKIYNLDSEPFVYENIRFVEENPLEDLRYKKQLNEKNKIKIIYTGGLTVERAWPVIEAVGRLGNKFQLFLLGNTTPNDKETIETLACKKKYSNFIYVGTVNRSYMRYYIQNCDIGVVFYSGKNTNEKYCASGKVYEYVGEIKPFVGPNLKPLKDLCINYRIGECNDSLINSIKKVVKNYDFYVENVKIFKKETDVFKNNKILANNIIKKLKL